MIKCGVCGSENEAAALFCGTCGSPLTPAEAKAIVEETKPQPIDAGAGGDTVVPGQGRSQRILGAAGDEAVGGKGPATGPVTQPLEPEPEPAAGGPTVICQVCGTVNEATRTYCRKCANELRPAAAPPPPTAPAAPPRKLSPLALGLGAAAAVVAIALVGVLLFGGRPGASPSPSATAGAVTPTLPPAASELPSEPPVTEPPFAEGDPTGTVAFARCQGSDTSSCRIFLLSMSDLASAPEPVTALADGTATDPALSSDASLLLYSLPNGLRLLELGTGDPAQTQSSTAGDLNAFFSPGDDELVFSGRRTRDPGSDDADREIRLDGVVGVDTRDSEQLTANDVEDHDPVFTPDGTSIVWVQGSGEGRELKMMDLESRDVTDLTSDEFNDVDPAVSPDGKSVVFAGIRDGREDYDLYLLDLETLEITDLVIMDGEEHDPAWSPGGRYIVFSASNGEDGERDIWLYDLADQSSEPITSGAARDLTPAWR